MSEKPPDVIVPPPPDTLSSSEYLRESLPDGTRVVRHMFSPASAVAIEPPELDQALAVVELLNAAAKATGDNPVLSVYREQLAATRAALGHASHARTVALRLCSEREEMLKKKEADLAEALGLLRNMPASLGGWEGAEWDGKRDDLLAKYPEPTP